MTEGSKRVGVDYYPNKSPDMGPNYFFRLMECGKDGHIQHLESLGGISNNSRYYPPGLLDELRELKLSLDENGVCAIGLATIAVESQADLVPTPTSEVGDSTRI